MTTRAFPPSAESVPKARRFVATALDGLPTEVGEVARLLVSELATNALVHARGGFEVTATYSARCGRVSIRVSDGGEGTPALGHPGPYEEHGRGLQLVAALSERWGVEPGPGQTGKTVWFELATGS